MNVRRPAVLSIVGLLLLPGARSAQSQEDAEPTEQRTIEELYLEANASVAVLSTQVRSGSLEQRLLAMEAISTRFGDGRLSAEEPEIIAALSVALLEGVTTLTNSGSRTPSNYYPTVRREAARLLGFSPAEEARDALMATLHHDPEPSVKAQAMISLGRIGRDPNGEVSYMFGRILAIEDLGQPDESLVLSGMLAIEMLALANGEDSVDELARQALVTVVDGNYPRVLRAKALDILSRM